MREYPRDKTHSKEEDLEGNETVEGPHTLSSGQMAIGMECPSGQKNGVWLVYKSSTVKKRDGRGEGRNNVAFVDDNPSELLFIYTLLFERLEYVVLLLLSVVFVATILTNDFLPLLPPCILHEYILDVCILHECLVGEQKDTYRFRFRFPIFGPPFLVKVTEKLF